MIALAEAHPDWAVGYADETWWSRLARPALRSWADGAPLRLVEPQVTADDPDPKALACYGLLVRPPDATAPDAEAVWLRFVDGRPVSPLTTQFLAWCCDRLVVTGVTTLVLVWDNAAWHVSREVRRWLRAHNQQVHRAGGVRLIPCFLPTKSPWLNPIEPKWVHGKRRLAEPARLLTAAELEQRICAAFAAARLDHLVIPKDVA
ncbi:MAG: transposase [Dehalococcoidia bacterium]